METVQLLVVEERFQLSVIGLTVVPDFPMPKGCWSNIEEEVVVVTPAGESFNTLAQFNMTHFNFGGREVDLDKLWRVVVSLPYLEKPALPVGSRVLVRPELLHAITVGNER